jgi:hypothetical protein
MLTIPASRPLAFPLGAGIPASAPAAGTAARGLARPAFGSGSDPEAAVLTLSPAAQGLLAGTARTGGATALSTRDPAKEVGTIQDELASLMERLQRALLLGDRQAAAAIAKEAAGLARRLADVVHEAAKAARTGGPAQTPGDAAAAAVEDGGVDGSGSGGAEAAGAAPTNGDAADGRTDPPAAAGSTAAQAATSSADAQGATGGTPTETAAGTAEAQAGTLQAAASASDPADIRAAWLTDRADGSLGDLDPALRQQVVRALVVLRAIMAGARSAVGRKEGRRTSVQDAALGAQVDQAEKELAEAEDRIGSA